MRRNRVAGLLAILAAATSIGLAACGDDESSGGSGADQAVGKLTIYSGRDEEYVAPIVDRFKTETGADVEVRYGDSAELAATIREEGNRSPADLFFSQDAGALGALQDAGLLGKLPDATLDKVDATYRSTAGDWVGTTGRVRTLAYDTRELQAADLPASVYELTEPRWKGKLGWAPTNASFQSFVTAMRKVDGEDRARSWLEDMKANDTQAYEKNSILRDAIADGEIQAGLINHYYILEGIREGDIADDGKYPVAMHFFESGDVGTLVNVAGIGVLAGADNAAGAQRFTDFVLADAQQRFFAEDVGEYPLVDGVAQDASLPALREIEQPDVNLADLADLQGTLELLQDTGVL